MAIQLAIPNSQSNGSSMNFFESLECTLAFWLHKIAVTRNGRRKAKKGRLGWIVADQQQQVLAVDSSYAVSGPTIQIRESGMQ